MTGRSKASHARAVDLSGRAGLRPAASSGILQLPGELVALDHGAESWCGHGPCFDEVLFDGVSARVEGSDDPWFVPTAGADADGDVFSVVPTSEVGVVVFVFPHEGGDQDLAGRHDSDLFGGFPLVMICCGLRVPRDDLQADPAIVPSPDFQRGSLQGAISPYGMSATVCYIGSAWKSYSAEWM
jgi:hypothetical protein